MKRFSSYTLAVLIGIGTGSLLTNSVSANTLTAGNAPVKHGTDAAFQDGLYMGKHDANEGRLHHVSTGRWSTPTDRSQYQAGYDAAYSAPSR
jgi:uncharacterized protein with FMN-binding domain